MNRPTIAIIGLGLMGGSLAYALKGFYNAELVGFDIRQEVVQRALKEGAVHTAVPSLEDAVAQADITLFCTAPGQILRDLPAVRSSFKTGSIVSDICGVKQEIVAWAERYMEPEISYIGLHPMAGKEVGGFANADPALFRGAGFILVLPENHNPEAFRRMEEMAWYVGAGRVAVNSAADHDRIIAYTSDLMHVAACGLCETFPPDMTPAYTAGAFRDCTRIADIDAALWTDLFLRNKENLLMSLSCYLEDLQGFQAALEREDAEAVFRFLEKAAGNKKEMRAR